MNTRSERQASKMKLNKIVVGVAGAALAFLIAFALSSEPVRAQFPQIFSVRQGGTGTSTAFTLGSVVFAGTGGIYTQDNSNFFWDATNHFLRLGGTASGSGRIRMTNTDAINARNAANNGDIVMLDTTSGNVVRIGASGATGVELTLGNLYFVGETSATPMLHSSGATIQALLADQSARANFQVAQINSADFKGQTNCASSAGTCAAAPVGSVSIAAAATTVTVASTIVTANSAIILTFDSSLGSKLSVTCNTTMPPSVQVSARTPGVSFVITATASVTNPACFNYFIAN